MNARAAVFIACSLDGFIARPDGDIGWLNEASAGLPEGEDCGYGAFMADVDAIVMGRKTFEQVLSFEGAWPYGSTPLVVLSRRPLEIPERLAGSVSQDAGAPEAIAARLAARGARKLYVDGGRTVQAFLAAGPVDEITVTLIPVLLGAGIPLFGPLERDLGLTLVSSRAYEVGFVQLVYRVGPEAGASDG